VQARFKADRPKVAPVHGDLHRRHAPSIAASPLGL
jgi:hypothetical protein